MSVDIIAFDLNVNTVKYLLLFFLKNSDQHVLILIWFNNQAMKYDYLCNQTCVCSHVY